MQVCNFFAINIIIVQIFNKTKLIEFRYRIVQLCDKWEKVLSHGIRTNLSNSSIQSLVTAGLNFTFNIINVGELLFETYNNKYYVQILVVRIKLATSARRIFHNDFLFFFSYGGVAHLLLEFLQRESLSFHNNYVIQQPAKIVVQNHTGFLFR